MKPSEIVQITVAICKEEVEGCLGANVINSVDGGSPWGRAFFRALQAVEEGEAMEEGEGLRRLEFPSGASLEFGPSQEDEYKSSEQAVVYPEDDDDD